MANGPVDTAVSVRLSLMDLEDAIKLSGLSDAERNIFAALILSGGSERLVRPGTLRAHALAEALTHPTYHRALRSLIEQGYVEYTADIPDGRGYRVSPRVIEGSDRAGTIG